jgi:hypothetical protein
MDTHILLIDNGSYKAESVLNLRDVAERLSICSGRIIHPVSLLHSNKISADKLNGLPAQVFEPYIIERINEGIRNFLVLPLFFGRSAAIYEYLPQRVGEIKKNNINKFDVKIAPPLVDLNNNENDEVAQILAELVRLEISKNKLKRPAVTVVDHGTPRIKVNEVRNFLSNQLSKILKHEVESVNPSSMESRAGDEYSFNKPLLEEILGSSGFDKDVVLSMLFISPGRHACKGGDVDMICKDAKNKNSDLRTYMSGLFSEHSGAIDILNARMESGLNCVPI